MLVLISQASGRELLLPPASTVLARRCEGVQAVSDRCLWQEFSQTFPDHPLPRLVFAWAPLEASDLQCSGAVPFDPTRTALPVPCEASFALTAFGVLTGLASPAHQAPTPLGTILLANFLRLVATLALGVLLGRETVRNPKVNRRFFYRRCPGGCVSCWFIASRKKMRILKLLFQDPATEGGIPVLSPAAQSPESGMNSRHLLSTTRRLRVCAGLVTVRGIHSPTSPPSKTSLSVPGGPHSPAS